MTFLRGVGKLLANITKSGIKSGISIKKRFDSEPAECEKYLRTKTKSCKSKIKTFFHNGNTFKKVSDCICFSLIWLDTVIHK